MDPIVTGLWRRERHLRAASLIVLALTAAVSAGCLTISGQPCPRGGSECPTGFACVQESCEPVGSQGVRLAVQATLDESVRAEAVHRVLFESYRDDRLECWLQRDPTDQERFDGLDPDVQSPIVIGETNDVRVPAGRHLFLLRALGAAGEVLARGCAVLDLQPGTERTLRMRLIRADGYCGDSILDYGEQCDDGEEGSTLCSAACEARSIALRTGSRCLTEPTIACTRGSDDDGRCLIGWIEDGTRLVVNVRLLDGREDSEADRGLMIDGESLRSPSLVSAGAQASVLWLTGDEGLEGANFNYVGQEVAPRFHIDGDTSTLAAVVGRYVTRNDEPALVAGWVAADGALTLEQVDSAERFGLVLPQVPADDVVATIFNQAVVLAWTEDNSSSEPPSRDVVGIWGDFVEGTTADGPSMIHEAGEASQSAPWLTPVAGGQVFVVWSDTNNAIEGGDQSGSGIRGRRVSAESSNGSVQVNTHQQGDQLDPVVVSGDDYVVVAWLDQERGELRARYLDNAGGALRQPFDDGLDSDFLIADVEPVGRPIMAATDRVFFLWLEDQSDCPAGGRQLNLRLLPPPLR